MAGRHRKDGAPATGVAGAPAGAHTIVAEPAHAHGDLTADDDSGPAPRSPAPAEEAAVSPPPGGPWVSEAPSILPVGSSSRRVAREQQRRRSRRSRWVVTGVLIVALAAAAATGLAVLHGRGGPPGSHHAAAARPQTTLLLQVVDPHQATVAAVLLGHDTRGQGTGFGALIPSALVVNVPGSGSVEFGATSQGAAGSSGVALSDALGVTIDGTWTMDQAALAGLVDAVGGVDVTVDRDVTAAVPGGTQLITPAGQHHLAGAAAAAYGTFLAAQEPEQARLARFSTVLGAVLAKLPADAKARAAVLAGLGGNQVSTVPASTLDTLLGQLRADAAGQRVAFDTLPTRSLDLGTGSPALLVDPGPLQTMISQNFADSQPPARAGGQIRVLIQNGVGTPGLSLKARAKLLVAGLTYVGGGNASRFGYAASQVLVTSQAGASGLTQAQVVATALGLPGTDVRLTDQGQTIADVVVILGADFKP